MILLKITNQGELPLKFFCDFSFLDLLSHLVVLQTPFCLLYDLFLQGCFCS